MTPAKARTKLQSLNAAATKVYDAVPVQEAWTIDDIVRALHRQGASAMAYNIVQGCLKALVESGLVKDTAGRYQRTEIHRKTISLIAKTPEPMPAATPAFATPATIAKPSPLDLLEEAHQKLTDAVEEFEVALSLTKDFLAQQKADLAKLEHLRTVLKEL